MPQPSGNITPVLQAAPIAPSSVQSIVDAYHNGLMSPSEASMFEGDVKSGRIMLPKGVTLDGAPPPSGASVLLPQSVIDAYNAGAANPYDPNAMPTQDRQQLDADLANGHVSLPQGAKLNQTYAGIIDNVKEAVTGTQRATDSTRNLPNVTKMPELDALSVGAARSAFANLTGGSEQLVKSIQNNFPDVKVSQDEKGNPIFTSAMNGKQYALPPGFGISDLYHGLFGLAAFTPSTAATTIAGSALASGATQAGLEAGNVIGGGTADLSAIPTAAVIGGVVPLAGKAIDAAAPAIKGAVSRIVGTEAKPIAQDAAVAAPEAAANDAAQTTTQAAAPAEAQATANPTSVPKSGPVVAPGGTLSDVAQTPVKSAEELAQTARTAANGSIQATNDFAVSAAPNPEVLASAKRLGIEDYLQPDHVTTDQAFRELVQGVKSVPGSTARAQELEGLQKVAQRADALINEIGGTQDISSLSGDVKNSLQATQQELEKRAEDLYSQMRQAIPARTTVEAPNVLNFIQQRAEDLGGIKNLSPMEKMIAAKLTPKSIAVDATASPTVSDITQRALNGETISRQDAKAFLNAKFGNQATQQAPAQIVQPTYALLDDVRQNIGQGLKNAGVFKDAPTGIKKALYAAISQDQAKVAADHGVSNLFNQAKSAVQTRKGIENDLTSLFGKAVDGSIQNSLSTAVSALPKGNTSQLVKLITSVPKDMRQQVVASGLGTAFGKNARNGSINFNSYAKWYEGLLANKQSYNAIMTHLPPEARQQLHDLYNVSKSISLATRERITTGRIQAVKDAINDGPDNLMQRLYGVAGKVAKGVGMEVASSAVGMHGAGIGAALMSAVKSGKEPAIKAVDTLISSPEFKNSVTQIASGEVKPAVSRLAYSQPFIKFVRAVGAPREMSNKEQWILQALENNNNQNNNK